jgi:hypothetical protein
MFPTGTQPVTLLASLVAVAITAHLKGEGTYFTFWWHVRVSSVKILLTIAN